MSIAIKRAYDSASDDDGERILVDRVWPRGVSKARADLSDWYKSVAPSTELRKWFGHDPDKFDEFRRRFRAELDANADAWQPLLEKARQGPVTLVFSARDEAHNNAVVLKEYLDAKLEQ